MHWDLSTWLAKRAIEAQAISVEPPQALALPGAKQAVAYDRLCALQEAGHGEQAIVERTNAQWRAENAARLDQHARWVAGPYQQAIEESRRRAAVAAAEELRRAALLEQIIAERAEE